jgi:hypothetical protein
MSGLLKCQAKCAPILNCALTVRPQERRAVGKQIEKITAELGLKEKRLVFPREQASYLLPLQNIFGFSWMRNCVIWAFTSEYPF